MEKANKRIIYEAVLVHNAFNSELAGLDDAEYSRYHQQNADWYRSFSSKFNQIVGFTGQTVDEFTSYVSSIDLTPEQKRALVELRREPMFKRLMGETALQQKAELETVLGNKITDEGMTFADERGPRVASKTEQQLEQELDAYSDKLSELLSTGTITDEQYDSYNQNLDYIYSYYMSRSKGEQVPFRKMTNAQYEQVEERALENGIDFSEQMRNETKDLMYEHEEIQELQSNYEKRHQNNNQMTTSQQADAMIQAMVNGQLDTNGQPIVDNQEQMTNDRQMGFAKVWLLGLITTLVSVGIIVLGIMLTK